jgi:hypothetical protein
MFRINKQRGWECGINGNGKGDGNGNDKMILSLFLEKRNYRKLQEIT